MLKNFAGIIINVSDRDKKTCEELLFYPVGCWMRDALERAGAKMTGEPTDVDADRILSAVKDKIGGLPGDTEVMCVITPFFPAEHILKQMASRGSAAFTPRGEKIPAAICAPAELILSCGTLDELKNSLYDIMSEQECAQALVCTAENLSEITARMRTERNAQLAADGVMIIDAQTTYISPEARIEPGAVIMPNCIIYGASRISGGAVIGPNSLIEAATVGSGSRINNSQIYKSTVGRDTTVGPFAYIRPDCTVGDNIKVGDFVELKNAKIGDGTKISHLTYVGDAVVGCDVNFGCGTVTVNYDGSRKCITEIADGAFIGCNTNLVAPVKVGQYAYTAAGSTVTKDVPDGALVIARACETVKHGWVEKKGFTRLEKIKAAKNR